MKMNGVPKCELCGHIIKPEVVLYEEALNEAVLSESCRVVSKAEVLIVGGTSLRVYPAAGLLKYFNGKYIVLINKGETPYDNKVDLLIRESIGKTLKEAVKCII
jgi:NAD-dependent deacetylase